MILKRKSTRRRSWSGSSRRKRSQRRKDEKTTRGKKEKLHRLWRLFSVRIFVTRPPPSLETFFVPNRDKPQSILFTLLLTQIIVNPPPNHRNLIIIINPQPRFWCAGCRSSRATSWTRSASSSSSTLPLATFSSRWAESKKALGTIAVATVIKEVSSEGADISLHIELSLLRSISYTFDTLVSGMLEGRYRQRPLPKFSLNVGYLL